jgi:hypothetical protein
MKTRAAFFRQSDQTVVFYDTPTHRSWLCHIESWLSILVRTLLTCGSVVSVEAWEANVLAFPGSSNHTANPFTWTSQGKALTVSQREDFSLSVLDCNLC